jgi:hypothetical protein
MEKWTLDQFCKPSIAQILNFWSSKRSGRSDLRSQAPKFRPSCEMGWLRIVFGLLERCIVAEFFQLATNRLVKLQILAQLFWRIAQASGKIGISSVAFLHFRKGLLIISLSGK